MKKAKHKLVLLFSIVLIVGAATGQYLLLKYSSVNKEIMVEVLKPTKDLKVGDLISNVDIKVEHIPQGAVAKHGINNYEDLVGKRVIVPISSDEQFAAWKVTNEPIAYFNTTSSYYAFPTNAIQNISNKLRKGNVVDVWVEVSDASNQNEHLITTRAAIKVIENLYIASVQSVEGIEVTDSNTVPLNSDITGNSSPISIASQNIYVMEEDVYRAYVEAMKFGSIKLSLKTLSADSAIETRITDEFIQLLASPPYTSQMINEELLPEQAIEGE